MTMLVSLEQAKIHQRIDNDDEDSDVELKIAAASAAVMEYLKADGCADFTDSSGEVIEDSAGIAVDVPKNVQGATLLMFGYLYKDRDNDVNKEYEPGYLPRPVTALLYGRRTPSVA